MEKFTANVLFGEGVLAHREVAGLRASGYEVIALNSSMKETGSGHDAVGAIVQGKGDDLEAWVSDLERALHPSDIIDDFGVAG